MKILLLQFFWLSFAIIGAAEISLYNRWHSKKLSALSEFLSSAHTITAFLVAFATGLASFIVFVAPACFLQLPLVTLKIVYIAVLVGSLFFVVKQRSSWVKKLPNIKLQKSQSLFLFAVISILALDFYTALKTGGMLEGDAKFELAQITLFTQKHFTIADPMFGPNGVPVVFYSTNIFHAMQALATNLLHVSTAWVWYYSYPFVRLLIWLSLFALTWETVGKRISRQWLYAILVILPFWSGAVFLTPELHNRIVIIWSALFLIGIKLWIEKDSIAVLLSSAILIAASHPLNAVIALGLLGLISIVLIVIKLLPWRRLLNILPIIVLLILPMALFYYYPHGITPAGFNDGPSSGPPIQIHRFGPFAFNPINLHIAILVVPYIIFFAYLILGIRTKPRWLSTTIVAFALLGFILRFNPLIFSLIGYGYLLYAARERITRLILGLLFIYPVLFIFNPILLTIANNRMPLWVLSRFQDMNIFIYIAPILGLFTIFLLPLKRLIDKQFYQVTTLTVSVLAIVVMPIVYPTTIDTVYRSKGRASNLENFVVLENLQSFREQLFDQTVFSDDPDLSVIVPGVVPSNVLTVANEANANPAVHIEQRNKCAKRLTQTLSPADLKAFGVTVIITTASPTSAFGKLLNDRADLKFLGQKGDYRLYKVNISDDRVTVAADNICNIPPTKKH